MIINVRSLSLHLMLVLSLIFNPIIAYSKNPPVQKTKIFVGENPSLPDETELSPENARLTSDLLTSFKQMIEIAGKIEDEVGFDGLVELIQKEKSPRFISESGQYRIELYLGDGIPMVRAVDLEAPLGYIFVTPTELNVLFKDPRSVSLDSPHMKRIDARQHVDANNFKGRDTVYVIVKDQEAVGTFESSRPAPLNRESMAEGIKDFPRWAFEHSREYVRATGGGMPTTQQNLWAAFNGAVQYGMVIGLGMAKQHLHPSATPVDFHAAAYATAVFGYVMTAFGSTVRNWQNRGSTNFFNFHPSPELDFPAIDEKASVKEKAAEYVRRAPILAKHLDVKKTLSSRNARIGYISLAYSYSLLFALGNHLTSVTYVAPEGFGAKSLKFLETQFVALPNLFMNNANKVWVYQPSVLRAKMRINTVPFLNLSYFRKKFSVEEGEIEVPGMIAKKKDLSKYDIEYQSAYFLKSLPLKLADLMSINIPTPWFSVPISRLLLLASIPYFRWRSVVAGEKIGDPDSAKAREEFESTWYMRALKQLMGQGVETVSLTGVDDSANNQVKVLNDLEEKSGSSIAAKINIEVPATTRAYCAKRAAGITEERR